MTVVHAHARRGTRGVRQHYRMAFLKGEEDAPQLRYNTATQELTLMSPSEFLRLAGGTPPDLAYRGETWREHREYAAVAARMQRGQPLDAPFLDVDVKTGVVTGHEGRHRAVLARELGIEKIPVVLYHYEHNRPANIRQDPFHPEASVVSKGYTHLSPIRRRNERQ